VPGDQFTPVIARERVYYANTHSLDAYLSSLGQALGSMICIKALTGVRGL